MDNTELAFKLNNKTDLAGLVDEAVANPAIIGQLLEMVASETGSIRFRCTKVVRLVSERCPERVYPYFDRIVGLFRHANSFLKWDGIAILANLVPVDQENRFSEVKEEYLGLIADRQMITAGNVIGNAWKIIEARPALEPEVTRLLLTVPDITYYDGDKPSPECNRIACGHVLDCFDRYFGRSANQAAMLDFARTQLTSDRPAVAKKAVRFLAKHTMNSPKDSELIN